MTPEQQLHYIIESLRLVAAPAELQISVLPDFVSPTDEVSTTFGDAYLLVPNLVRLDLIRKDAAGRLADLDAWFEKMPTDGSICETESLKTHEFWQIARNLANDALLALEQEFRKPDLSFIGWIQ